MSKLKQDWCKKNGLNSVPELYYGYAKDFIDTFNLLTGASDFGGTKLICKVDDKFDSEKFLQRVKLLYTDKPCYMCKSKLPEEGCVVRIEGQDLEVFKCKSTKFLEYETKQLDKMEIDIENEQ